MSQRIKTIGYVLILLGIWGYVQDKDWHEKTSAQAAYTKALERTLAKCLSGGDQPIQIGDELWLCGATNSGLKVRI